MSVLERFHCSTVVKINVRPQNQHVPKPSAPTFVLGQNIMHRGTRDNSESDESVQFRASSSIFHLCKYRTLLISFTIAVVINSSVLPAIFLEFFRPGAITRKCVTHN